VASRATNAGTTCYQDFRPPRHFDDVCLYDSGCSKTEMKYRLSSRNSKGAAYDKTAAERIDSVVRGQRSHRRHRRAKSIRHLAKGDRTPGGQRGNRLSASPWQVSAKTQARRLPIFRPPSTTYALRSGGSNRTINTGRSHGTIRVRHDNRRVIDRVSPQEVNKETGEPKISE